VKSVRNTQQEDRIAPYYKNKNIAKDVGATFGRPRSEGLLKKRR